MLGPSKLRGRRAETDEGLLAVCEVRSKEVKGQILAETSLMSPFIKHQVITAVLNMFQPDVVVEMF